MQDFHPAKIADSWLERQKVLDAGNMEQIRCPAYCRLACLCVAESCIIQSLVCVKAVLSYSTFRAAILDGSLLLAKQTA